MGACQIDASCHSCPPLQAKEVLLALASGIHPHKCSKRGVILELIHRAAQQEHRRETRLLEKLERADRKEVEREADSRLAEMLLWCKHRVPYYRHYLDPVAERHLESSPGSVLADLPPLEKSDLHDHFESLTAKGKLGDRVRRNATGGSTGQTARFLQDLAYRRWNRAVLAQFERWTGWRCGDSKVVLWGIPRDVERAAGPVHKVRDRLLRRTTLNAYNLSTETMAQYIELLQRERPALLRVFTQSGAEFARHILREHDATLSVGAVSCAGAMLLDEYRQEMTRAFGASVFDSYGSREVGPMAAEKRPGGGMFVSPATHRLEILREDGTPAEAGEEGEIHVTLLVNRTMPLIRYRIGDRGIWRKPRVNTGGPAWPCLARIVGRTMEHVLAADGTRRNSQLMSELVMHVGWIRRFQWVQDARDRIELRIEPHQGHPAPDESARLETELSAEMRRIIGPDCRFEMTLCDRIAPSPSGKYHYVVCTVN